MCCLVVIIIDGYDIAVAGAALPSIMKDMGVTASTAGFMASSALFGMMFGAIFLGVMSDKIGRRWTISVCVFLFSVFTALAGLMHDPISFSVVRFIAGLGIGGVMPNIVAQMTEYSPRRIRSFMTTVMFSGYAIGGILAALIGKQFIADFGWQIVFFAAGAPVLMIPFILKFMPESLSFLAAKGEQKTLAAIAARIAPAETFSSGDSFSSPRRQRAPSAGMAELFKNGRGLSTVMFWIAFFTGLFMIYALSTWLTKLMAMSGYSLGSALSFVIALNVGAVIGSVGGGWLADRFHIKWVLVTMYAMGSVFLYLLYHLREMQIRVHHAARVNHATKAHIRLEGHPSGRDFRFCQSLIDIVSERCTRDDRQVDRLTLSPFRQRKGNALAVSGVTETAHTDSHAALNEFSRCLRGRNTSAQSLTANPPHIHLISSKFR